MTSIKTKAHVHKNDGSKAANASAHTTTIAKPKSKSAPQSASTAQAKREDVVDEKAGKAKAGDAPKHNGPAAGGQARKSAVHARMGAVDVPIANKKKELNPTDNPEWFWNGHKKWKTA